MRHLFLVRSSLQFLLAAAMAEDLRQRGTGVARMLFLPDVLDPGLFARVAAGWRAAPFDCIDTLTPHRRDGGSSAAAVRSALRLGLAQAEPAAVTVFNDREEAGQTLLAEAARRFPATLRRCAEDGALAYTGFTYRSHGHLSRWRQRLRVGLGWADVRVLGTHPLVQEYIAMHPALLRPELRGRVVRSLPTDTLNAAPIRQVAAAFCAETGCDAQAVPAGAALLTLGHSDYARRNPDFLVQARACLDALVAAGTPTFVKHHPREAAADPFGFVTTAGVHEVPRTVPVECLYLLLSDRALQVIGGMSTSLLTAALLMPNAQVLALRHATGAGDAWSDELLRALKIGTWAQPRL